MQHNVLTRGLGRVGACLAFALPILVLGAPPSPAAAQDYGPVHQRADGHLSFPLTSAEVPTGGDPGGSGFAWLDLDRAHGTSCFVIKWQGLAGVVTAAHLHTGSRGTDGPQRIELFADEHFMGKRNTISGCVQLEDGGHGSRLSAQDKIRRIIESPSDYYLDVYSAKFPDGAIRGQLDSVK